jgi:hypothetical protein
MGEWKYSSTILDLGTRWRWVVSLSPRPLYPLINRPRYPSYERMGGPQSRSGEEKILPWRDSNLGRAARILSLCRLFRVIVCTLKIYSIFEIIFLTLKAYKFKYVILFYHLRTHSLVIIMNVGEVKTLSAFSWPCINCLVNENALPFFIVQSPVVWLTLPWFAFTEHTCEDFRCNREICIHTDLVCDEVNHCGDGSDELSSAVCTREYNLRQLAVLEGRAEERGTGMGYP